MRRLRLAIVGAGEVARRYHVPAALALPEVHLVAVVDTERQRAVDMARKYGLPHALTDPLELVGKADLAIVTVPNYLHSPVTASLLEAGIHVLCEKPMAVSTAQCEEMIRAAEKTRARLAIGHNRRFKRNMRLLKSMLDRNWLGEVVEFEAEEGSTADWQRGDHYFDKRTAGGGALIDVGIHAIDLIHCFVGPAKVVHYEDDSQGTGVESEGNVCLQWGNQRMGTIRVSRNKDYRPRLTLRGERGWVEAGLWDNALRVFIKDSKISSGLGPVSLALGKDRSDDSFVRQLHDFVQSIVEEREPFVTGRQGQAAVRVVEECYQMRKNGGGRGEAV